MSDTYTITLTPYQAALLDAATRAAGLSLPALLAGYIATVTNKPTTTNDK